MVFLAVILWTGGQVSNLEEFEQFWTNRSRVDQTPIVQQIGETIVHFWVKSVKFGTGVGLDLLNNLGYGAKNISSKMAAILPKWLPLCIFIKFNHKDRLSIVIFVWNCKISASLVPNYHMLPNK